MNRDERKYFSGIPGFEGKMTDELSSVLWYLETILIHSIPTPKITTEHLIIGLLSSVECMAYQTLTGMITDARREDICDAYVMDLRTGAVSAIKPTRVVVFDDNVVEILKIAMSLAKKIGKTKISSNDVLLALLSLEEKQGDHKSLFKRIMAKNGVTYKSVELKIASDEDVDDEDGDNVEKPSTDPDAPKSYGNSGERTKSYSSESQQKTKKIDYCTNLNQLAKDGKIDRLVGREKEIRDIIRVMGRRKKNNVILVGPGGVGKTAIAEGIAYLIVKGKVPPVLADKVIMSLNMTSLMAGTSLRGMFEARVETLLEKLKADPNMILFIDNIDSVLADKGKNDYDISSMLAGSLEKGDVQVIGTSTFKGYRNTFDADPSLGRRFQKITVEAPSEDETMDILTAISPNYEKYHKVKYTKEALRNCVELASRFITDRNLPDSAIDLMDEAGSQVSVEKRYPDDILGMKADLETLKAEKKKAKSNENYDTYDELEEKIQDLVRRILIRTEEWKKSRKANPVEVNVDRILDIVYDKTGIPISKLSASDKEKLQSMEHRLHEYVIGQNEAVEQVCRSLKRNRVGLRNGRTMGSFMFLGSTGTGKTLLAKEVARELFGSDKSLVRFDMSEYGDTTSVNKLIGANPGFVGYEEGGLLTEAIKNKKHCVLLLDEIEKAHSSVYNMFLQVMDEGFLTDNSGQKIDFKNVIIILTTNVGVRTAESFGNGICFNTDSNKTKKNILNKEMKKKFPPEFLNRLDGVVYFNQLSDENMVRIVELEFKKLVSRLSDLGYECTFDRQAVDIILGDIKDEREYGARPVIRSIQDCYENVIVDRIIDNTIHSGDSIVMTSVLNEDGAAVPEVRRKAGKRS